MKRVYIVASDVRTGKSVPYLIYRNQVRRYSSGKFFETREECQKECDRRNELREKEEQSNDHQLP